MPWRETLLTDQRVQFIADYTRGFWPVSEISRRPSPDTRHLAPGTSFLSDTYRKRGAVSGLALRLDRGAPRLHESLADGQSEPGAAGGG